MEDKMKYTPEQKQIINTASAMRPGELMKILAFAGTGKTFTLIEIIQHNPGKKFLFLAFNAAIAKEVQAKLNKAGLNNNAEARTTHSLAYKSVRNIMQGRIRNKNYKIAELPELLDYEYKSKKDERSTNEILLEINSVFNDFCNSDKPLNWLKKQNKYAYKLFKKMETGEIDYTHSFYLKFFQLSDSIVFNNYDYVLLDECQDTNAVTLDIFLKKFPNARKIMVGDDHQQIYRFRGSDNIMSHVDATYEFNLTYTFRCCQNIVNEANYILRNWKKEKNELKSAAKYDENHINTTAYLSRTNAFLIKKAKLLHSKEIPFKFVRSTKEIFSGLLSLANWLDGNYYDIDPGYKFLNGFSNLEEVKAYAHDVNDVELLSTINIYINEFSGSTDKIYDFYNKIKRVNLKKKVDWILSTAHTAKGLEWDKVVIANDFPNLFELLLNKAHDLHIKNKQISDIHELYINSQKGDKLSDEANLIYVAVTRAKKTLEFEKEILNERKSDSNLTSDLLLYLDKKYASQKDDQQKNKNRIDLFKTSYIWHEALDEYIYLKFNNIFKVKINLNNEETIKRQHAIDKADVNTKNSGKSHKESKDDIIDIPDKKEIRRRQIRKAVAKFYKVQANLKPELGKMLQKRLDELGMNKSNYIIHLIKKDLGI